MPNRNASLFLTLCSYPSGPRAHLLVEDDWSVVREGRLAGRWSVAPNGRGGAPGQELNADLVGFAQPRVSAKPCSTFSAPRFRQARLAIS